jgi:hypothetical protein
MNVKTKTVEYLRIKVAVQQRDINGGLCGLVARCMHKVSIERSLRKIDNNGGDHKVRCDGSDVKFALNGYRWHGHMPKIAKNNLIQFDKERSARAKAEKAGLKFVSNVKPHTYTLEAERGSKITPFTRERMEQVYEARRRRAAEGRPDKKRYDLRYRVQGLGNV